LVESFFDRLIKAGIGRSTAAFIKRAVNDCSIQRIKITGEGKRENLDTRKTNKQRCKKEPASSET